MGGVCLEEIRNLAEYTCHAMAEELKRLWPNLAQISEPARWPEACWNSNDDNIGHSKILRPVFAFAKA